MNGSDLFDDTMDLEFLEQEVDNNQLIDEEDEFGDDDLDLTELVEVADTVEQQHAVDNGNISFVSTEDDPIPPPPLPESTTNFHPIHSENLRTWIYPTNYPIRGYQFNIVQKAMFNNTLVALPTGLGKTFIAAVVMFNYWRWFPNSKIIFMAPTRPLVEQQIEACFTICGLPQEDTVEITGSTLPAKRRALWQSKRVFFATPQTIQRDIESHACPAEKIACVVIDEAHKATGNYAYTEVVRKLYKKNNQFRVLALTATPGSKLDAVQHVVNNLHITNIQIRTEDSMDIREFSHGKNVQNIVVKLGYTEGSTGILPRILDEFRTKVFHPMLLDLSKKPINVYADVDRASPFGLMSSRQQFQAQARNLSGAFKFSIISQMLVAESASRAHDLLCQHGVVPFLESIEGTFEDYKQKKKMTKPESAFLNHSVLNALIRNVKQEVAKPDFIGHPKMNKLIGIMLSHFSNLPEGQTSKVMIFSSFRSSVVDICKVLDRHRPMIRSSFFVGQSTDKHGTKGLKQSEQQQVIQKFKRDEFNVLVSTSIGEEGLDIGEVDLIVCYDSQTSPIRMLQRMGRTGRKRKGKCILLLTEAEEKKFATAKEGYARIQSLITRGDLLTYYKPNPTVLPPNYRPTICKKKLTVGTYQPKITPSRKRKRDIVEDFNYDKDGVLKPEAERVFVRSFCDRDHNFTTIDQVKTRYWPIEKTLHCLNKYVPLQARVKPTFRVGHSKRTSQLVGLVQKCEHYILHPEEKIGLYLESRKGQQTKLKLPSKLTATKGKKKAQEQQRRNMSMTLDDEDFTKFMENNDLSRIVDTDEFAPENIKTYFIIPSKKKPATAAETVPRPLKVKGKEKETSPINNDFKDDVFFGDFDDQDREPSWEPLLPDSFSENVESFIDTHRHEEQLEASTSTANHPIPHTSSNISMDTDQSMPNIIAPPSPKTHAPKSQAPVPVPQLLTIADNIDQDSDEFFDFPMDDAFIAQTEALIASKTLSCFDETVEPTFPFEISTINTQRAEAIGFIWAHAIPNFSDKAMQLLEKRQNDIKELTGQFVTMNLFPQFKSIIGTKSSPSKQQQRKIKNNDTTAMIELNQKEDQQITQRSQQHEVITINESQSLIDDDNDDVIHISNENNVEEEEDFEFNEGALANFLENKIEDDECQGFPYFMIDPESAAPPQSCQIMSKSFLYADKSSADVNVEKEEDDNQSFEYIFSQDQNEDDQGSFEYNFSQESAQSHKVLEEQDRVGDSQEKQDEIVPEMKDLQNGNAEGLVEENGLNNAFTKRNHPSQALDSDKESFSLELDLEDYLSDNGEDLDLMKENSISKTTAEKQDPGLTRTIDENERDVDEPALVDNQLQEGQNKMATLPPQIDAAIQPETAVLDQEHHSVISIQSNHTDESPIFRSRSFKKTKTIFSEDEQEDTFDETSPIRKQSPSLLNQLSKHVYTPSPLRIQSSDNEESPIRLFRKRKSNRSIQDGDEDEVVLVTEKRQKRKGRLKRKSVTPVLFHSNSTILEEGEEDEEKELVLIPPSKDDLLERLKQSSYGVHKHKRSGYNGRSRDILENPFIDAEAEKSSDEGHTDEELEEDQGSSCMNSFIDDNSSLEPVDASHTSPDEVDLRPSGQSVNYAERLHKEDHPMHEKHWLNRFNADKWLIQEDDDEDQVIGDTDEESIQDFSSDFHNLERNMNDGGIMDDDFI